MPNVLLINSESPNRYSNLATGLCTPSTESLTPTILSGLQCILNVLLMNSSNAESL